MKTKTIDFEKTIAELEDIVGVLDAGEVPLEKALALYEKGVGLADACEKALAAAKGTVEKLSADGNRVPLDTGEGEA